MNSNICGNCGNFSPLPGEKFFNCSSSRHAGLSYGMQVRADTRACEAFVAPEPTTSSGVVVEQRKTPVETVGLCSWGELSLVLSVLLMIVLVSWLLYTCAV